MDYVLMEIKLNRPEGGIVPIKLSAENFKYAERPRSYSASGYGSKVPTSVMVKLSNRWHRVYCAIWANSGTTYVVRKGEKLIVDFY